jgi:hypothetical protein
VGIEVSASICNVGVLLYDSPDSVPPGQLLMRLNYNGYEYSGYDFQRPSEAASGALEGFLSVGRPTIGSYTSANDPSACGILSFGYVQPAVPAADCGGGTPPNCPTGCRPGCTSSTTGSSCDSCIPTTLNFGFRASARSNCAAGVPAQAVTGSWSLQLASLTANSPGTPSTYAAHGQLTASLVGTSPADAVTLALAF